MGLKNLNISISQLEAELKYLRDTCFWSGCNYWSTKQPDIKRDRTKTNIKVGYLTKTRWFTFIFKKHHQKAVQICRNLRQGQKWFYQETINSFLSFSAWCVDEQYFDRIYEQLRLLPDVELEFVIPPSSDGLRPCDRFVAMQLEFYQVGHSL